MDKGGALFLANRFCHGNGYRHFIHRSLIGRVHMVSRNPVLYRHLFIPDPTSFYASQSNFSVGYILDGS